MAQVERLCSRKGCDKAGKAACSACSNEFYCSKECQQLHWPEHKAACKPASKVISVNSFEKLSIKQLKKVLTNKLDSSDTKRKEKDD
jgi:hypothetical protein